LDVRHQQIGYSFPPFTITTERAKIRELARAIGDDNPGVPERASRSGRGYQDVLLPPTIATTFLFWGNNHFMHNWLSLASIQLDLYTRGGI